ncbi:MAG TPA: hypothetical protein VHO90_21140 [Bacteroidales bacterium]|nr:hypothetical protein [Bacteroidales bacterium]
MELTIIRRKQLLSFLPVSVSVNKSDYRRVDMKAPAQFNAQAKTVEFTINLWGMKKRLEFELDSSEKHEFELLFNLSNSFAVMMLLGVAFALYPIILGIVEWHASRFTVAALFFLLIFLFSIFNSLVVAERDLNSDNTENTTDGR